MNASTHHDSTDVGLAAPHTDPVPQLNGLGAGQPEFPEGQRPRSNQVSRTNSVKDMSKSTPANGHGNYTAPSSAGLENYGFPYPGEQATPDSLTTSGVATPYNHQSDPRSNQLSPSTNINQSMHGLDLSSISRSLSGPLHPTGTLPHIVEHSRDRSNDMDWPLSHANEHDDYSNGSIASTEGLQHNIKSELNHSNGSFPLIDSYPSFQALPRQMRGHLGTH